MSSLILSEQERNARMMSLEERSDLLNAGWSSEVVNTLYARGFRESAPITHADRSTTPAFLRQTTLPHIHIELEKGATLEDLDTAIYEAGEKSRHQYLADRYHAFTDSMKGFYRPQRFDDLEARVMKLENEMTKKTQKPTT